MMGMILYDGFIDSTSTSGANHWATYAHQEVDLAINGINFSVPFSGGFDVTWEWPYEQATDEHTWRRY